jgi:nucleoside-diphosphate-sugar epimerase
LTADFRSRPLETVEAHVGVLKEVLKKSKFDSLLYLSSTRVYEGATSTEEDAPLTVNPNNPNHIFNLTKLAGETCCLSQDNKKIRIARISNVLGSDYASENFVFSVMKDLILNKKVELRTTPTSTKDYILIDDVVDLLPKISSSGKERIYNVASGSNLTNKELLAKIANVSGGQVQFLKDASEICFPPISVKKIKKEFDFQPKEILGSIEKIYSGFERYLRE